MTRSIKEAITATKPANTLLATRYFDEVAALAADPILQAMEKEIPATIDIDQYGFSYRLNAEYTRRGGQHLQSIGGCIWAVKAIRSARN